MPIFIHGYIVELKYMETHQPKIYNNYKQCKIEL